MSRHVLLLYSSCSINSSSKYWKKLTILSPKGGQMIIYKYSGGCVSIYLDSMVRYLYNTLCILVLWLPIHSHIAACSASCSILSTKTEVPNQFIRKGKPVVFPLFVSRAVACLYIVYMGVNYYRRNGIQFLSVCVRKRLYNNIRLYDWFIVKNRLIGLQRTLS